MIIGMGEVGTALYNVLDSSGYPVEGIDVGREVDTQFTVVHICFPYSEDFINSVKEYKDKYLEPGGLLIIHSTVPIGTCEKLRCIHSPIRGVHPNLAQGIKTFKKYFGGERAEDAANYFAPICPTEAVSDSRQTEALKLLDTTQLGYLIVLEKKIYEWCKVMDLDFDFVYREANKTYNEGYMRLNRPEVVRPWLKHIPGPIGGHCVVKNAELIGSFGEELLHHNESY